MPTQIAVISTKTFSYRLLSIAQNIPNIQLKFYYYTHPKEASDLLKEITPCDALLIGGSIPYHYMKQKLKVWPTPWTYIVQDEASISTTLLAATLQKNISLHRMSIDTIDPQFVDTVLNDIHYEGKKPYVHRLHETIDETKLIETHTALWQQEKVDLIITSIHSVHDLLQARKVPVMHILDSTNTIMKRIEDTAALARLSQSEGAKGVIGIFNIRSRTDIESIQKIVQAPLHYFKKNHYLLYTTVASLQTIPFEKLANFKVAFGYGKTINEALQHAENALQYSSIGKAYAIDEQKKLKGPLPFAEVLSLQTEDAVIHEITKKTTLSPLNISKLIQFSHSHAQFTAQQLSDHLNVSKRTAERLIKKLSIGQYVEVVGEEMTYQKGRPRAIYVLKFPTYLS